MTGSATRGGGGAAGGGGGGVVAAATAAAAAAVADRVAATRAMQQTLETTHFNRYFRGTKYGGNLPKAVPTPESVPCLWMHPWDPHCTTANGDMFKTTFAFGVKMYGTLFAAGALFRLVVAWRRKRRLAAQRRRLAESGGSGGGDDDDDAAAASGGEDEGAEDGRRRRSPKGLAATALSLVVHTLRSSAFLASMNTSCSTVMCLLARVWDRLGVRDYPLTAYLVGLAGASFSITLERKERRADLGMYCANQALEVLYRMLIKRGWAPVVPHGLVGVFSLAMAILGYCYQHERESMNPQAKSAMSILLGGDC